VPAHREDRVEDREDQQHEVEQDGAGFLTSRVLTIAGTMITASPVAASGVKPNQTR
jgi:hypothetical protein